jgi:hypothetical protein
MRLAAAGARHHATTPPILRPSHPPTGCGQPVARLTTKSVVRSEPMGSRTRRRIGKTTAHRPVRTGAGPAV